MRKLVRLTALCALVVVSSCKASSVTAPVKSAGETVVSGAKSVGSVAASLVSVNLSNVLNDLAVDLRVDKANIPINAQIPITIAANVCGVSINILSIAAANTAKCTATTTSPQLTQVVGQQLQAGTGTQTGTTPTTTESEPTTTTPPK